MNVSIKNGQQFQSKNQRTSNKTEIKFTASSKDLKSIQVSGDLELQNKPRLGVHFHFRPETSPFSFSSSLTGEANNLKDFKIASTYIKSSYKLKFQAHKGFILKDPTGPSWTYQMSAIGAYRLDNLYENGLDITHEETVKNSGGVEGATLLKFGRSNSRNFGALVEHRLNVAKGYYVPKFSNLLWFYNTPEALITLKLKNIMRPHENFAAMVVSRFTKNIEVGVQFDYDAAKNTKNLQYGVLHHHKDKEFRIKIKDNLEAAMSYNFRVTKRIHLGFSYKFAIGSRGGSSEYMFPMGIKLDVKD